MNSKEKMNPNTKKILTTLKLPEDQLKLAKDYITGAVGEEALEMFSYKDLSSLSAYDVEHAMPSKNYGVRYTSVESFIKLFGDCEFMRRCAIVAVFMGACDYLARDVRSDYGEDFVSEQRLRSSMPDLKKKDLV